MHIYTAAVYSNSYMPGQNRYVKLEENEREIVHKLPHILESWHYVGKQAFVDAMRENGAKVFLDSGAFSAYTLGVTLSVEDYCKYICDNWDIIRFDDDRLLMASVLDGIGDAEKTWQNQQAMEHYFQSRGWNVKPLPCFHFGEPPEYLERYVRDYEYITLGGMVGASTQQLREWLEKVWQGYLLDPGTGRARIKVHGFGITAVPLMEEFDWYSCDSSSWIQSAAFGSIVMPGASAKNPAMPIAVSSKSPSRHDVGQHITTLSPPEREHLHRLLAQQGFTEERVAEVYESRAAYNLWAFCELNKLMDERRRTCYITEKQQDLFGNRL
jgi:hypothetical protein